MEKIENNGINPDKPDEKIEYDREQEVYGERPPQRQDSYYEDVDDADDYGDTDVAAKVAKEEENKPAEQTRQLNGREERRKRRTRRKRRFLIVTILILLVALAIGSVIFIDKNGYADIETIVVEGNSHYDTVAVLKQSGAVTGVGMISLRTGSMVDALEKLPYVKSAKIVKNYPHTLKIVLEERTAEYAVYVGGYYIYLDNELFMLEKSNDASGLKVIEGFPPQKLAIGEQFTTSDNRNFENAKEIADIIKEKGLSIFKVSYRNSMMRVYFTKNIVCEGTYDNLMKYISELNEILYSLSTQGIERATIYIGDEGYISFSPKIE